MLEFLQPEGWKPAKGYANGVAIPGGVIITGGQIGWNADQVFESDDFVAQCRQALVNVVEVVRTAGAGPGHIAKLTWYVTDRQEYLARQKELGAAYRDVMGRHFPAMTMVEVKALIEDRAKVEIEAIACRPLG